MSSTVPRLIRDQQVAVLYSPGYGAGWSTWCFDRQQQLQMIFDIQIADIVDQHAQDWYNQAQAIAIVKYPQQFLDGLKNLKVSWLPVGTKFRIIEHDGDEQIEIEHNMDWIVA
jgi:hypothetical protein